MAQFTTLGVIIGLAIAASEAFGVDLTALMMKNAFLH